MVPAEKGKVTPDEDEAVTSEPNARAHALAAGRQASGCPRQAPSRTAGASDFQPRLRKFVPAGRLCRGRRTSREQSAIRMIGRVSSRGKMEIAVPEFDPKATRWSMLAALLIAGAAMLIIYRP